MYDRGLTDAALATASAKQGWDLVPHTLAEVDEFSDRLNRIYDAERGQVFRALTAEEERFISNERRYCALDFDYWSTRYVKIIDWRKNEIRFRPNVAQNIVRDIWGDLERRGIAIMMAELKARQLGVTTFSAIAIAHRVQFLARTNAVMASADPKKTQQMGGMIKFLWERQPWWLIPTVTKVEKFIPVEFGEIDSSILIQAGNQFHGVARGQTPNVGLLSEVSSWENAEEDIDASLLHAIHPTPDVLLIFESTALGRENWWFKTWELVKKDWPAGKSMLCPVFLPWFVGTDIWPTPTDLKARPIPDGWVPQTRTVQHAERAREYVLANPLLLKHLAKGRTDWTMPRAQMWFYEVQRDIAVYKKELNKFLSEMPANDMEAFQNRHMSVIDQDLLQTYRDNIRSPLGVYTIIGPKIHQSLVVPRAYWDRSKPTLRVPVESVCRTRDVYHFVPVTFEGYSNCDANFKLFIYEMPEDNGTYGIGVDTSDGIGEDASAIEGIRKAHDDTGHAQVCEYVSPYIKADQMWPMVLAIAAFYSPWQARTQKRTQCRVAVEIRGNGEVVQSELQKRGWVNFHPWKRYDNRRPTQDQNVYKIGVYTNQWFRAMLMDKLLTCIDEEWLAIGSPWLVDECGTLERDPERTSARAGGLAKDDRVMALGIILTSLTVDDKPTDQRYGRRQIYLPDAVDEVEAQVHPTWRAPAQATDFGHVDRQPLVARGRRQFGALGPYVNRFMPRGYR